MKNENAHNIKYTSKQTKQHTTNKQQPTAKTNNNNDVRSVHLPIVTIALLLLERMYYEGSGV